MCTCYGVRVMVHGVRVDLSAKLTFSSHNFARLFTKGPRERDARYAGNDRLVATVSKNVSFKNKSVLIRNFCEED